MGVQNPNSTGYQHPDESNLLSIHRAMGYDTAGRPVVRTGNFLLDVSRGIVPGHSIVFIGGRNRLVPNNTEATIWSAGGLYPWSTFTNTGSTIHTVSSSGASDSGVQLFIEGLDSNYNVISSIVTLNQSGVSDTGAVHFYRINSALVIGSKEPTGNIVFHYSSATGTVVGRISAGANRLSQSVYTVPAGYTAFSVYGDFGIQGNESAELRAYWRFHGGVFVRFYVTPITGASFVASPPYPGAIPEKTDIDNRVALGTNNLTASSNQQLLLVNNSYL